MSNVNAPCVGCFICGDPGDHDGMPHSVAMADGKRRIDVDGPAVPVKDWDAEFTNG